MTKSYNYEVISIFSDSFKKWLGSGPGVKVFWIRIQIQLNTDPKHWTILSLSLLLLLLLLLEFFLPQE